MSRQQQLLLRLLIQLLLLVSFAAGQKDAVMGIFQNCHKRAPDFDACVKHAFNELIVFYKTGILLKEFGFCVFDEDIGISLLRAKRHSRAWHRPLRSASVAVRGTTARHRRWHRWLSIATDRCVRIRLGQFESDQIQVSEVNVRTY